MKLKFKSLALASVATIALTGSAQAFQAAEDKKVAEDPVAKETAMELLGVGSVAPALEGVTWVQGDEIKSLNETGKLYIVECWATWCGPCVAIIPHMNELHKKYSDKGLVIVGMNVWEEGIEKAQEFVKKQGDGMSYHVAYSGGKESQFTKSWLEASQTNGIPQAFVVRDGKIIFKGHPASLSEATIEEMMSADFNADEFAKKQVAEQERSKAFSEKIQGLFRAQDWVGIKELAMTDEFIKGKKDAAGLIGQANQELNDWEAQAQHLKDIVAGKYGAETKATRILGYGFATVEMNDQSKALAAELEPLYVSEGGVKERDFFGRVAYSRVLFFVGKDNEAVKEIEAVRAAVNEMQGQRGVAEFIAKLDESIMKIKEGTFPPLR